jgi:N-dimethylarginine dimethylaminohydrolase
MADRVSSIEILAEPPKPFFYLSFQRMSRLRLRPNTAAQSAFYVFSDNKGFTSPTSSGKVGQRRNEVVRNEGERLRRVVVCAPRSEYFQVENPEAHNIGEAADRTKATAQHAQLRSVLRRSGAKVVNLPELAGHPNSVFARDTALLTPAGYVRLRMGLPTRRGEEEWMAAALDSLGVPCAGKIEKPGTVEGGDVILAGEVVFVGLSERTNRSGVRQLSQILNGLGFEVRTLSLTLPHLHIGGAMSVVGPRAVVCCRGVFPRSFLEGYETVEIPCPEDASANVIALGNRGVIVEKRCVGTAQALLKSGFRVHLIDLSEFVKGRGGPTCLILPVDRTSPGKGRGERIKK